LALNTRIARIISALVWANGCMTQPCKFGWFFAQTSKPKLFYAYDLIMTLLSGATAVLRKDNIIPIACRQVLLSHQPCHIKK